VCLCVFVCVYVCVCVCMCVSGSKRERVDTCVDAYVMACTYRCNVRNPDLCDASTAIYADNMYPFGTTTYSTKTARLDDVE
jgi:hypothetical protein